MSHAASFSLAYSDAETADRVERSLFPEVGDIEGDRTTATLTREGATLSITVDAADLVALRAGVNTWLSLASVAERAGGLADGDAGATTDGASDNCADDELSP